MTLSFIFLDNCTFLGNLPMALALCLLPFILGWLAASAFYNVSSLKSRIASLTTDNNDLTVKVSGLNADNTDLRVKITQLDAEIETLNAQLRKVKNDLIICEGERNVLKGSKPKPATVMFAGVKVKYDDLKIVEGIGPKIADLLIKAGIKTWKALSETAPEKIKEILDAAGPNFQIHDPATWPEQSRLADEGEWDKLKKYQDELKGGRDE
ncbi:MAG: DUF4332 domain-containing protein [Saprospiraceae bacterium]|nr:DUF4332 domain-containing protein [Saprospiraceae bacterium]